MSEQARYFRVGVFVLVGLALLVGAVLVLGGRNFSQSPVIFETYFDESVQGLEVGSAVKFRGVNLGVVSKIGFVESEYIFENIDDQIRYGRDVLVRIKMSPDDIAIAAAGDAEAGRRYLEEMIDRGLRLRLATQGLTGTAYIEADYLDPKAYPPRALAWKSEEIYVPAASSRMKSFSTAAERMIARLEDVDVERVLGNFDRLLVSLTETADEVDIAALERDAGDLLADLRSTSIAVRAALTSDALQRVPKKANATLTEISDTLAWIRESFDGGKYDLEAVLENMRVVSENLRDLSGTAKSYPSYFILGGPPERSEAGE